LNIVLSWAKALLITVLVFVISACGASDHEAAEVPHTTRTGNVPGAHGADASVSGFGKPYSEVGTADEADAGASRSNPKPSDDSTVSDNSSAGGCGFKTTVQELPTCCDLGAARCLPSDTISEDLKSLVADCSGGGACVPEDILLSMQNTGKYEPKTCKGLTGDGRCVSLCVPMVAEYKDLLPQDVCSESERCTPCISPLDNKPTGACGGAITCEQSVEKPETNTPKPPDGDNQKPAQASSCENPPSVDSSVFPACGCAGTRCVPNSLATPEQKKLLESCDNGGGVCVPDIFISTGGFYAPTKCQSVGGVEGRCLSTCLPDVAKRASVLPSAGCNAGEVCSPCCDPFSGKSTGACDQECDSGPAEQCPGISPYETCCDDGSGHCVDKDMVPSDKQSNLKKCGPKKKQLCLPKEFQDPNWGGSQCTGYMWITGQNYQGVCLPECLKLPKLFLDKKACAGNFVCTPCINSLTGGPTGAPGCP